MSNIERLRVPDYLPEPMSQYTDGVLADGWLYVSGIIAVDKDGKMVGGDDVTKQAERVLENMGAVLAKAGASFQDVVKVNVYLARIGDRAAVNVMRKRFFGDARPASTLVEVSKFVVPEALLEIDCVARLP